MTHQPALLLGVYGGVHPEQVIIHACRRAVHALPPTQRLHPSPSVCINVPSLPVTVLMQHLVVVGSTGSTIGQAIQAGSTTASTGCGACHWMSKRSFL